MCKISGTGVDSTVKVEVPQLSVDLRDFSSEILRPDFIDDLFFPYSDDDGDFDDDFDDDEDVDHAFLHQLIEGIGKSLICLCMLVEVALLSLSFFLLSALLKSKFK